MNESSNIHSIAASTRDSYHFGDGTYHFYMKNNLSFIIYHDTVSILMFSTFEHSVDMLYRDVIQRKREECSRAQQLGVTCMAGYASGAVGTIISNPADNIVSSLYNKKADSILQAAKNIGFPNLFTRSLPVRITLVGPVITLQWFFYDTIKVLTGLPTSGGIAQDYDESQIELMRKSRRNICYLQSEQAASDSAFVFPSSVVADCYKQH
ncbi:hypothetical protein ZIOFF_017762 [Zingiber officinale]|uniref:Uncharacterized protein n=1 Tax=Zingiber officinale TaxID=94328 RepID=A0A8J5H5I7_ZINOF|nr:hypothetical protein ZIOFF_017762 [Zingiber officinale]